MPARASVLDNYRCTSLACKAGDSLGRTRRPERAGALWRRAAHTAMLESLAVDAVRLGQSVETIEPHQIPRGSSALHHARRCMPRAGAPIHVVAEAVSTDVLRTCQRSPWTAYSASCSSSVSGRRRQSAGSVVGSLSAGTSGTSAPRFGNRVRPSTSTGVLRKSTLAAQSEHSKAATWDHGERVLWHAKTVPQVSQQMSQSTQELLLTKGRRRVMMAAVPTGLRFHVGRRWATSVKPDES